MGTELTFTKLLWQNRTQRVHIYRVISHQIEIIKQMRECAHMIPKLKGIEIIRQDIDSYFSLSVFPYIAINGSCQEICRL